MNKNRVKRKEGNGKDINKEFKEIYNNLHKKLLKSIHTRYNDHLIDNELLNYDIEYIKAHLDKVKTMFIIKTGGIIGSIILLLSSKGNIFFIILFSIFLISSSFGASISNLRYNVIHNTLLKKITILNNNKKLGKKKIIK